MEHDENQPLVYILILNYCSLMDTIACSEHVRRLDYPNIRMLVIDNASPDGSGKALSKHFHESEFVQNITNSGYSEGNNIGIRIALRNGAKYIFVLNPDVRIPVESVSTYVNILERDRKIGALNPIQVSVNDDTVDPSFLSSVLSGVTPYPSEGPERLHNAKTLLGAALFLPASTLQKVGGFDPLFFAYGEEEDFCRRIKNSGLNLVVTESAPVVHARTREKSAVSNFVLFLRLKGAYLYDLKNPDLGFRFALKQFIKNFARDIFFKRINHYPFNRYPIRATHIFRSGAWIIFNLRKIKNHRHRDHDKTSAPYLT